MKKNILIVAVLGIAVLTFGLAGFAYAQDQTPPTPEYPYGPNMMNDGSGYGRGSGHGMMGGFGGYGMMGSGMYGDEGPMHEVMIASLADALGLSADEIEARHDAGETIWDIAAAEGLSTEEIQDLMFAAHDSALEDAVANGWLTQEQADWMDGHMEQMWDGDNHCGGSGFNGTTGRGHMSGMNW